MEVPRLLSALSAISEKPLPAWRLRQRQAAGEAPSAPCAACTIDLFDPVLLRDPQHPQQDSDDIRTNLQAEAVPELDAVSDACLDAETGLVAVACGPRLGVLIVDPGKALDQAGGLQDPSAFHGKDLPSVKLGRGRGGDDNGSENGDDVQEEEGPLVLHVPLRGVRWRSAEFGAVDILATGGVSLLRGADWSLKPKRKRRVFNRRTAYHGWHEDDHDIWAAFPQHEFEGDEFDAGNASDAVDGSREGSRVGGGDGSDGDGVGGPTRTNDVDGGAPASDEDVLLGFFVKVAVGDYVGYSGWFEFWRLTPDLTEIVEHVCDVGFNGNDDRQAPPQIRRGLNFHENDHFDLFIGQSPVSQAGVPIAYVPSSWSVTLIDVFEQGVPQAVPLPQQHARRYCQFGRFEEDETTIGKICLASHPVPSDDPEDHMYHDPQLSMVFVTASGIWATPSPHAPQNTAVRLARARSSAQGNTVSGDAKAGLWVSRDDGMSVVSAAPPEDFLVFPGRRAAGADLEMSEQERARFEAAVSSTRAVDSSVAFRLEAEGASRVQLAAVAAHIEHREKPAARRNFRARAPETRTQALVLDQMNARLMLSVSGGTHPSLIVLATEVQVTLTKRAVAK